MTNSSSMLKNIRMCHGSSQIQVANRGHIHITKVRYINPTFKNAFVLPKLSARHILVGQLVENFCNVCFSRDGYFVQD
jgi:hypothetical protein